MGIKRYFAPDMRQAIRQVRDEQGPHPVISSDRRLNGGMEIVSALDRDDSLFDEAARPGSASAQCPPELPAAAPGQRSPGEPEQAWREALAALARRIPVTNDDVLSPSGAVALAEQYGQQADKGNEPHTSGSNHGITADAHV